MNKTNEKQMIRLSRSAIIASALIAGSACNANARTSGKEYARMQPVAESRMEAVSPVEKDFFFKGISADDIKESAISLEIPIPSTATIAAKETSAAEEDKYALREISMNETIRYQNFSITLLRVSYTFKEISATFIITAGEDEWKVKMFPKRKERIDYLDSDAERAWRLNFVLDEINLAGTAVLQLMQQRIKPEEVNRRKSE